MPALDDAAFAALPGLCIHDLMMLPVDKALEFFERVSFARRRSTMQAELVLAEIRTRLRYLRDVGLSYLTLDRQSRTLSGGEVQRINLTTALGTSLVNTLFVLDEPSVGLHARDLDRVIGVLTKLRDAGNTLLVVEHDAQVMLAADRIVDLGPGPGRAGGRGGVRGSARRAFAQRRLVDGEVSARRAARSAASAAARPVARGRAAARGFAPRASTTCGASTSTSR